MINMSYIPSTTLDSTRFWIKLIQTTLLSREMSDMVTKDPGLKGSKQSPVADPYKFKFVFLL